MNISAQTSPHKDEKMASFSWSDPFLLDDQLTEDERMIRDAAAGFASDRLLPRVEEAYLEEKTDPAIFSEMGQAGLCLLYTSPSPRDLSTSRMPSSA